jgi:hypothetical protein
LAEEEEKKKEMMVEYGVANNRLLLRQFVNPVDEVTRAVTRLGDFLGGNIRVI